MPLTSKGREILARMKKQYGDAKGERVFYATRNKGKITGVDRVSSIKSRTVRKGARPPGDFRGKVVNKNGTVTYT